MSGRDVQRDPAATSFGPSPRPVLLDDALVVDVLASLAGADTRLAVASAGLPLLLAVEGVRAAAVVVRDGARVVLVGSAGYDCGTMAPGAQLPLDAGMPVTEAVRTGQPVVQGKGPSWVAVPFGGRAGALLLSLYAAPPEELARLQRIARAVGDGLRRAAGHEQALADLAVVASHLATPQPGAGVTTRSLPYDGPVGGDVALCLPDGRGGRWLVVADVCGAGLPAAVVARTVHATFTALAPYVQGAAALLSAVDVALRGSVGAGLFVTALVVHEADGRITVASAGHPPLVLLTSTGASVVVSDPGLPLALALERGDPAPQVQASLTLPADAVLLLHSDGLVDRRVDDRPRSADPLELVAGRPVDDLEALADAILAAAAVVGAAGDDVTLLLARPLA